MIGFPEPVPTEMEPLKYPRMLGVKTTWNVHAAPAASAPPQGLVPDPAADQSVLAVSERFSAAVVVLVAVTVFGKLENPSAGLSKRRFGGLNVRGKAEPPVPVPLRLVICGRNPAPLTMNDPLMAPLWVGLNVTDTVHFAPPASDVPQGVVPDPTTL